MRIFLLLFLFLSGCATGPYHEEEVKWQGQSVNALIQQKGAPDYLSKTSDGKKEYVYTDIVYKNPLPNTSNPTTIVAPNGRAIAANIPPLFSGNTGFIKCVSTFYINRRDIITSALMQGGGCLSP